MSVTQKERLGRNKHYNNILGLFIRYKEKKVSYIGCRVMFTYLFLFFGEEN
jgi:hypothetical protein